MYNMSSENTFGKVRLNEKVESRVRGDLSARFGGECLETCHGKTWQGAGCLASDRYARDMTSESGISDETCEPIAIGQVGKQISNMTFDKVSLLNKL